MQNYIQLAYLASSFIAIIAMVPQLRQLVRVKHSKEMNVNTWATWAACQVVSLAYALSVRATAYAVVSAIWIALYLLMVVLILRYKYNVPLYILNIKTRVIEQAATIGSLPIQAEQLAALKTKANQLLKTIGRQP